MVDATETDRIAALALHGTTEADWRDVYEHIQHAHAHDEIEALAQDLKLRAFDTLLHTNLDAALRLARFIHTLGETCALPGVVAVGLLAEADAARQAGQAAEAMAHFERAGTIFQQAGDQVGWARARGGWLVAATHAGRITARDVEQMDEVCQVLRDQRLTYRLAMVEQNMAIAFQYLARYDAALATCDRALAALGAATERHEHNLRAMLLGNKANVLLWLGDLDHASALHRQARAIFAEIANTGFIALADMNLAVIERLRWNLHEALRLTQAGVDGFRAASQPIFVALGHMHRADLLLLLNRAEEAVAAADEAVAILRERQFPVDLADALYAQARAHLQLGEDTLALACLREAEALMAQTPGQHGMYPIMAARAALLLARGQAAEAKEIGLTMLRAPVTQETALHRTMARLVTAEALLALGQRPAATALATAIVGEADTPELRYRAHVVLARAARDAGSLQTALVHFDHVAAALRYAIGELVYDQRAEFLEDKDALYSEALTLALDAGDAAKALCFLEQARERATWTLSASPYRSSRDTHPPVDELDGLRARHRSISASLATLPADAPTVGAARGELTRLTRQIRDALEARAEQAARLSPLDEAAIAHAVRGAGTVIAYALAGDDLLIFVLDDERITPRRLSGAVRDLRKLERAMRLAVDTLAQRLAQNDRTQLDATLRRWGEPFSQTLQAFWSLLLAPVEHLLPPDGDPLTLVPHGILHALPMAALHDGHRSVVERWALRCVPSCLSLSQSREERPAGQTVVALGYGDGGALPAATEEAHAIARLLNGGAWVESEATSERLRRESPDCALLHLAAHGVLRLDNPNASFIQLADGPFHPGDVLTLDLRGCRLVTLSACRTGLGRLSGGDERIGLATAFARAGAEAVLSTLWRIDDAATLAFMRTLYQHIATGVPPADALRAAQLASLRRDDAPALAHPYFWAGFQLATHRLPASTPNSLVSVL